MNGLVLQSAEAPMPVRKPRLGFLGVGWIGRNRMEAIAFSGAADVTAIADTCAETARTAAAPLPLTTLATDLDELLEMELDGIVIATPSAFHAGQAVRALEKGIAVFCQKPLARTAAETRRVIDAAKAADRLLGVDFSYRLTDGMQKIRQVLHSGEIGNIYSIDLVFHNAYGPDKPWFYDAALAGGGCVMDLGGHLVDLALWGLDFPKIISCSSRLYAGGKEVTGQGHTAEDFAVATFDLDTGASVRLTCSWKVHAGCDAVIGATFYGTAGGLSFRNVNGSFYDFVAERYRGTARETLSLPPDSWGGRTAISWARRLAADPGFDPAAEHLLDVARALDSIYRR